MQIESSSINTPFSRLIPVFSGSQDGADDEAAAAALGKTAAGPQAAVRPITLLALTTLMAAASGLGALPFFFVGAHRGARSYTR